MTTDKAYGATRIHNRHKHLNSKYDVSELIMNVLYDDATVVTAEQRDKCTAETPNFTLFVGTMHWMQCCKLQVLNVRPVIRSPFAMFIG